MVVTTLNTPSGDSLSALLINPHYKHLGHGPSKSIQAQPTASHSYHSPQGRRKLRRSENANFSSNPHVTRPTPADYQLQPIATRHTFPAPPPPEFQTSLIAPGREEIQVDPPSAALGSFNRSLKGIRKNIRRMVVGHRPLGLDHETGDAGGGGGGRVEELLKIIDTELSGWVRMGVVWMAHDLEAGLNCTRVLDPTPYPSLDHTPRHGSEDFGQEPRPTMVELNRSPHKLAWDIPDPFVRYLCHVVARYYGIVSLTRSISRRDQVPQRMVWMIRAHLPTRQGRRQDGRQMLQSPPTTDIGSELSTAELSDVHSTTDDEDDTEPVPIESPSRGLLSHEPDPNPETSKTPVRATIIEEPDETDDSSRCNSDTEENESHLSDSGFLPPKPIIKPEMITPRGKPSWSRSPISTTPRPTASSGFRQSQEPAVQIRLQQQQYQQSKTNKVRITNHSVPNKSFLEWIWADT